MMLKFFLFALLALHGTQANNNKVGHPLETQVSRGLVEELEKLLAQLREAVTEAVKQLTDIARNIYEQLSEEIKELLQAAQEQIRQVVREALEKLKEIEEAAAAIGQDVQECVANERVNIEELNAKTQQEINACIAGVTSAADALVAEALATAKEIQGILGGLLNEWQECESIICRVRVLTKIGESIGEVREKVGVVAEKAAEFVRTEIPALRNCVVDTLVAHNKGIQEITGRVNECISNIGN